MGCLKYLVLMVESTLPPFLFVKLIEKVMRFFLSSSFEDMGIFHLFYLSICYGSIEPHPPPIKTKLKYVKNAHIFKATTQKKDLITFSIVFTNKIFFF